MNDDARCVQDGGDEQRYPNGNSNSTRRVRDRGELEQLVTAARLLPPEFFDRK